MVIAYFHPIRMTYPILPGTFFPGNKKKWWKPAKLSLPQNLSIRMDVLSVFSLHSRTITPWGKPSNLWTFESTFLDQSLPVEYKSDVFIPPLTGTLMSPLTFAMSTVRQNSAHTFSYFFPGQTFRRLLFFSPMLQEHEPMADYIISVLNQQHDLCYDCNDANPEEIPSYLIPSLFCLSILETFIPHFKIYGT